MSRVRVGVLRGGPSTEYEVSLKTGSTMLRNLNQDHYKPVDIFLDRAGVWHVGGVPVDTKDLSKHIDVVLNGLHGHFGEDGQVQSLLERHHIPYTGSRAVPSSLAFHKKHAKDTFAQHSIRSPYSSHVDTDENLEHVLLDIFRSHPGPFIVKPARGGSSVGVHLAYTFKELVERVREVYAAHGSVLVEEFIRGKEATVGVIEDWRGEGLYALPPVEIVPAAGSTFFDYDAKYGGKSSEHIPSSFPDEAKQELMATARRVHEALGLCHYSRTDFIVSPRGIFVLEVNTLPGMTEESLFPKMLHAVGTSISDFLHHLISLAQSHK